MRNVAICLVLLGLAQSIDLGAQTGSFGTLPLAKKENAPKLIGRKIQSGPKYERALRIYNALTDARGDRRYPLPTLVMYSAEQRVAMINYSDLEILLEEKAYDVCDSFGREGDAALATLLGHELSHYYEKHAWRRRFVASFQDLNIGMRLDSLHDDVANETQADYIGGFLAYSAGFRLFQNKAALIDSLYKAYGIPDQVSGYPSLSDRKALIQRTNENLKSLTQVFDMANLLTATGKFWEAYQYYKYILQEYQSREIYNNVGTTAVLHCLSFINRGKMKFHLPLELDLESAGTRGGDTTVLCRELLKDAIRHFDAAISMDPDYAPAYLNKACAYLLLGDGERAKFYADVEAREAARRSGLPKVDADVDILMGIMAANWGDQTKAQHLFESAIAKGSVLAEVNLSILLGKPVRYPEATFTARGAGQAMAEHIGKQSIYDIKQAPTYNESKSIRIEKELRLLQGDDPGADQGHLFVSFDSDQYTYSLFLCTPENYTGSTARDISLGASTATIQAAYGPPKTTIQTPQGQIIVYPDILFIQGPEDRLARWVLYYSLDQ